MEVILKWCSKSVFIYHKVTKKTKARYLFSFDSLWFILFTGCFISDFDSSIACFLEILKLLFF